MQPVKIQKWNKRLVTIVGAGLAASTLLSAFQPAAAQALAGRTPGGQNGPRVSEQGGQFYSGKSALLRNHEDDAALSDGSQYADRGGPGVTLFDSAPGTDDNNPSDWDYLVFRPKDGRRLVLSSDFADGDASTQGNQPLVCEEGSYLFFGRFRGDRDWLEELPAVGDRTTGDASFDCWIDDPSSPGTQHRYYDINWYPQAPLGEGGHCVTYSRTGDKTLRFEAPPATVNPLTSLTQDDGCPAAVRLVTRTKEDDPQTPYEYTYDRKLLGYESAPMQLTVEFGGRFL